MRSPPLKMSEQDIAPGQKSIIKKNQKYQKIR